MNSKVTIVMYHYVRDVNNTAFPKIKARSIEEFENQVKYFQKYYSIISVDQLLWAMYDNYGLPDNSLILTFDDGYIDHYIYVFPILKKHKISGCFYPCGKSIDDKVTLDVNKIHFILASVENPLVLVNEIFVLLDKYREEYNLKSNGFYYDKLSKPDEFDTGDIIFIKRLLQRELVEDVRIKIINELFKKYVTGDERAFSEELYMNRNHLTEMIDSDFHIGSHGYNHYWFNTIGQNKQEVDINKSLSFLKSLGINTQNWTVCYPHGAYNEHTLGILKKYGCRIGFTAENGIADITQDNPFLLPRRNTNNFPFNEL